MSTSDSHAPASLLPQSSVVVFSNDSSTKASAENLPKDWRFPRVDVQIYDGDIDTAISKYAEQETPDLIIIQTAKIEESLTGKLTDLAEHCDEGTSAIIIGPVNDVNLYRKLTDMGVSDYLVAPLSTEDMAEVIARTLTERLGVSDSKLFAFVGAKGGVGTSTLAQATAWGAADILKQKTILIDGAGGWSSSSVGLGFEPTTTLAAAARAAEEDDDENLERMIVEISDNLSVLGSGGDVMLEEPVTPEQMEGLTNKLMTKYPLVITDLSGASPELQKSTLMQAGHIAVVATPFLTSLRLARTLIQEIVQVRDEASKEIDLIVNMLGLDKTNEVPTKDLEKALDMIPAAVVNFASSVFMKNESEGKKILDSKEGRELVQSALLPILRNLLNLKDNAGADASEKKSFLDNIFSKDKK